MPKIKTIVGVMAKQDADGNDYYKTLAIMEDGDELWGFSREQDAFKEGDSVQRFFHHEEAKMRRKS